MLRDLASIKLSARYVETLQGNGDREQMKLICLCKEKLELQSPVFKA